MAMPDGRQIHHDGGVRDGAVRMHTIIPEGGLGCWPRWNVIGTAECEVVPHSCSVGLTGGGAMLSSCRSNSSLASVVFLSQGWVWDLRLPPELVGGTCRTGGGTKHQRQSYLPPVCVELKV